MSQIGHFLRTGLYVEEIPEIYKRFSDMVGPDSWKEPVRKARAAMRNNPLLADYLEREHEFSFELVRVGVLLYHHGGVIPYGLDGESLVTAMGLVAQIVALADTLPKPAFTSFKKRVIGAFGNPAEMRALRFEFSVATHFARRGNQFVWPEATGRGIYDLLILDEGESELEVECKSISNDKGRGVHRREALEFFHLVSEETKGLQANLSVGLSVVVTVPDRLPRQHSKRVALAALVNRQLIAGKSVRTEEDVDIRIDEFDVTAVASIGQHSSSKDVRDAIQSVSRTRNREGIFLGCPHGGVMTVVLQSAAGDEFVARTFRTLKDAAKKQLSGTRPGLLLAGFEDIEAEQLEELADLESDKAVPTTALARAVNQFLAAEQRSHVVGIGFLSRSMLRPPQGSVVSTGGATYYFPAPGRRHWHDDFADLFH